MSDASAATPPPPATLPIREQDGVLTVSLPDDPPDEALREWLRAQAPDLARRLAGRPCRLRLGQRPLELFQIRRMLQILRDPHGIEVTGLEVSPEALHRYAERELKLALHLVDDPPAPDAPPPPEEAAPADLPGLADVLDALGVDDAPDAFASPEDEPTDEVPLPGDEPDPPPPPRRPVPTPSPEDLLPDAEEEDAAGGRRTLTLRRPVRSGTEVVYDRDVVILGDVNSGATVRAGGSVLVLGRLRGVVHAGSQGDRDAFILAFELASTQLRIADLIAIAPERTSAHAPRPEVARVIDDAILIEPWTGRLRR